MKGSTQPARTVALATCRVAAGLAIFAGLALGPARAQSAPANLPALPPHPRLLVTDAQLAAAKAAAATDPLRRELQDKIVALAAADLGAKPIQHRLIGPRLLDQCRLSIERIVTCAMAYRLTGDERYADQARRDLSTVVHFPDWNPSHFLDVAEMSFAVGIGYDWLYPVLSPDERSAIEHALLEKSLVFAPAAYAGPKPTDKRVYWVAVDMNWNQVCNGGLLTAALAIADQRPDLAKLVIGGVRRSLPRVMSRYQPDGAYPEGPGYWAYGTTYNVIILAEMEGVLGTDFGLGQSPDFDRTAFYRMAVQGPTGMGFNYADGSPGMEPTPAYDWLANRNGPPATLVHARDLLQQEVRSKSKNDRFVALHETWFPKVAPAGAPDTAPLNLHFRGPADIALFRSAWNDPNALFVGFKAGSNAVNHAHLDLGSFILDADNVRWAEDLGPDNYNLPDYFGKKRWAYFRLNNHSHNTLTPGDALQYYKADAPIVAFGSTREKAFAVADLSAVYPKVETAWRRGVAVLDRSAVLIQDEWTPREAAAAEPLNWVMVTSARAAVSEDGRSVQLSYHGKHLRLRILPPSNATFAAAPASPPTEEENPNRGQTLLRATTPMTSSPVRLAVLLSPEGPRWTSVPSPSLIPLADWK